METDADIAAIVRNLYATFSGYGPGRDFCTFCHSQNEIYYIITTSVRELDIDTSRKLLWETGDHWPSSEVYRHYLPRILEILGPPIFCEDLYPAHLSETLTYNEFRKWPQHEQAVVGDFLAAVTEELPFDAEDRREWLEAVDKL